jgi:L-ascorbate metabolism protein UlaG (beta-lactamase superfamily)
VSRTARLTWLGHSTVVVELDGLRLVTDPVFRRRIAHLRRDASALAPSRTDIVLLSHLHYDHLDRPSLRLLGREVPIVVPRGAAQFLRGFADVREVEAGSTLELGPLRVDAVDARHDGRRRPVGPPIPALGYVVRGSRSVYFAGDTELFGGMAEVAPVDVALVPVAGWGAKLGPGHLDPASAALALTLVRPSIAVPIHWGTYGVIGRQRGDRSPAEEFARAAAAVAPDVDVRILEVGGMLDLEAPGLAG